MKLNLGNRRDHHRSQLSGGKQQRITSDIVATEVVKALNLPEHELKLARPIHSQ